MDRRRWTFIDDSDKTKSYKEIMYAVFFRNTLLTIKLEEQTWTQGIILPQLHNILFCQNYIKTNNPPYSSDLFKLFNLLCR